MSNILWLIYRRTRVGVAFAGFILMYALYTGTLGANMYLVALSVFFAELFGACYNDSQDFEEDKRNNRIDKITISGILTPKQMMFVSVIMLIGSLVTATISKFAPVAVIYLLLMWSYSNQRIRLKNYHLKGYLALASVWLIIPVYLGAVYRGFFGGMEILFALFFFFQYSYLLSQKDATDTNDKINLFIASGWRKAANICLILSASSSAFLLALSLNYLPLVFVWGANALIKLSQNMKLHSGSITRKARSNFTLMEFLSPYLYAGGILLA